LGDFQDTLLPVSIPKMSAKIAEISISAPRKSTRASLDFQLMV
jgi:hypothetical protein